MKDYKQELDNYEYDKRYKLPKEHRWDSLRDEEEVKKFENLEHNNQIYEIDVDVFKKAEELLTPRRGDVGQSSPEITGQFNAKPYPEN